MKSTEKFKADLMDKTIEEILATFAMDVIAVTIESIIEDVDEETGKQVHNVVSKKEYADKLLEKVKEI